MKRSVVVLLAVLTVAIAGVTVSWAFKAARDTRPVAKVVGISVAKPDPSDEYERSMAAGLGRGVRVYFAYTDRTKNFVDINISQSKVTVFKDDKGTNLKPRKKTSGSNSAFWSLPTITEDKKGVRFFVKSETLPASDAKKIIVKGTLEVLTGGDLKTNNKHVAFQVGKKIVLDGITLQIKGVEAVWYPSVTVLQLETDDAMGLVKEIVFLDSKGRKIPSKKTGRSSSMYKGTETRTYCVNYKFEKKVQAATVNVTYYTVGKKVTVPFEAEVGLGL